MPVARPGSGQKRKIARRRKSADAAKQIPLLIGWISFFIVISCYGLIARERPRGDLHAYDLLAKAFMNGHLDLMVTPPRALLELPDPYDIHQNKKFGVLDTSLYGGKLYWYFGPVPAILIIPAKIAMGGAAAAIGDQPMVITFAGIIALVATLLLIRIRQLYFPGVSPWMIGVGILGIGLCLPMGEEISIRHLLDVSNAGGQAFLMLGIYLAWRGLSGAAKIWPYMAGAGVLWALSWGTRLSLLPAIAVVAGLTILEIARRARRMDSYGQLILSIVGIGLPLMFAGAALALYNYLRFNDWKQTGWDYQLAWMNHHALAGKGVLLSPRNIPINLYRYFIELPQWLTHAPFIVMRKGADSPVARLHPPFMYALEPVAGLLWSVPVCWLMLGLLVRRRAASPVERQPEFRWLLAVLFAAMFLGLAPVMFAVGSVERYLADGAPALTLLATLGGWKLIESASTPVTRQAVETGITILTAVTLILTGCLIFTH